MNVTIFFTRDCNLQCRYCYEGDKHQHTIDMKVLQQLPTFIANHMKKNQDNKLSILTHGGEPLIAYDKIKLFINQIKQKIPGVKFSITTNGTILNDEIMEFIVNEYDNISVSIDGTKMSHDLNRIFKNNTGSYDVVIRNALKILKYRSDMTARMTVNRHNVKYLFEGVKELVDLGFNNIMPMPDEFDKDWSNETLKILYDQCKLIIDYMPKVLETKEVDIGFIDNVKCKTKQSSCDGGITSLTINTDGKIYPCIIANGLDEFCLGDVFKGIDDTKMKEIHKYDDDDIVECLGCQRYDYCTTTRCKIVNKIKTDNYNEASPIRCGIEHITIDLNLYEKDRNLVIK